MSATATDRPGPAASRGPTAAAPAIPKGARRAGPLRRLQLALTLTVNAAYDARRLWKHSYLTGIKGQENLRSRMHMTGHFLEYGMSMRDPRKGFGQDRVALLYRDLDSYAPHYGWDATCEIMLRTLQAYLDFNAGAADQSALKAELARLEALRIWTGPALRAGSETVTRAEIQRRGMIDFLDFAEARHSVRSFAPGPVAQDKIDRAVRAAQITPSSCNRQTCRAWVWTEPEAVQRVLALQSGNRNFGDQITGVAVVASDLTHWYEVEERYQGWVDAGMFAMSLALGLHAEGLGAVMLNWGEEYRQDKALRDLTGIPESALVAVMIGFGNLPEHLNVPVSQREPLETCLTMNLPLKGKQ
jgi:nitroreductase